MKRRWINIVNHVATMAEKRKPRLLSFGFTISSEGPLIEEFKTNAIVERWFSQKRTVKYAGWPNAIQLPQ